MSVLPASGVVQFHGLRIYWEDTDAGGIVFYANYLKFFERARTEWLRARGVSQELLRCQQGLMFVVSDTQVRYLAPARLDDWVEVSVRVVEVGRASLTIEQQAVRRAAVDEASVVLAEGRIRIGCVDTQAWRPQRIPAEVLAALSS